MNIIISLFIVFLTHANVIVAMELIELHCNFSKYMFNYFKYGEKYLYQFENTISELELRKYGLAIKSHDEIIMIMLDALRELDVNYWAEDLIAINLYLNNVSGSLNMIAKNENGQFSRSESSKNLLEGYKIIHQSIVERLQYFVNNQCSDVSLENDFISYTDFNLPCNYMPDVLLNILGNLKNRLFIVMKEYLLWYVVKYDDILNSYTDIVKHLALSFQRKSYNYFNPKNFLFYDLMETRSNFCELELSSGSQAKQKAMYDEKKNLKDVLDMMRYSKIKKRSSKNYNIKLFDIFRFIKFDFDPKNMQVYHELINAATVRPIIMIIRYYFDLVKYYISIKKFRDPNIEYNMKLKIIKLGEDIIDTFKSFLDLNLFRDLFRKCLDGFYDKIFYIISMYKEKNNLFLTKDIRTLTCILYKCIQGRFLNCYLNKKKRNNDDHEYNVKKDYKLLVDRIHEISLYIITLKTYQYCFQTVYRYIPKGHIDWHTFKITFKHNIPFKQLGYYEDIYRSLYFHGDNTNDDVSYCNQSSSEENDCDEELSDDNKDVEIKNQTFKSPIYFVDYLLFA
ncbi:uncharacterized protein LOC126907107 [Daktulosphaira vitifoliae]|uniref:uncharacterized protein LOC126907107 n=1 Tax=Daktulosphaira vitifoliae TaxID=58002 RepID=UPI0021AAEDBE|nr:uncharacterized protein LOC126907107 [Daktulosphaira vitifoliae]